MKISSVSCGKTTLLALAIGSVLLAGCQSTNSRCRQTGSGMTCTFGGVGDARQVAEVSGPLRALAAIMELAGIHAQAQAPLTPATFDARLLKIDLAGSSVPVKTSTGTLTMRLLQNGSLLAESQFAWKKSGNTLVATDPAYMTAWVRSFPSANGYDYSTDVGFEPATAPTTTVQSNHLYNGASQGSTSVTQPTYRGGIGDDRDEQ